MSVTFDGGVLTVRGEMCYDDQIEVNVAVLLLNSYANVTLNGKVHTSDRSPSSIVIDGRSGDDEIIVNNAFWRGGLTIAGGFGDDTIRVSAVSAEIDGGGGDDVIDAINADHSTISGGDGADTLHGSIGNDVLNGGAGDDTILGSDGDDTLDGGDGNDLLEGSSGLDDFFGGAGDDVLDAADDVPDERVDGDAGTDTAFGSLCLGGPFDLIPGSDDDLISIEHLAGSGACV